MHILLVDDHVMFRQGVKFLLSDLDESLEFSEAGTCEQALDFLASSATDLILLDLNLPGSNALGALHEIRGKHPEAALVVLSGEDDPVLIRDAIEQGASGFVPKSSSSEVLLAALNLILAGGVYLPPAALQSASAATGTTSTEGDPLPQPPSLSARQTDVLLKAIQGKPNKVIAREMDIAEGTVKTHLSAAFRALGVHNRTEAVFAAARLGLRPPPPDQS
ncbi:MAG: response regulator transcription factor [Pseudomonadota bacterium]